MPGGYDWGRGDPKREAAERLSQVLWVLGYLDDIASDLSVFHRIEDAGGMEAGVFFKLACLRRTTASDNRGSGPDLADLRHLDLTQLSGYETKDAHAPRAPTHFPAGFGQELVNFRAGHQRQGEERQSPVLRHSCGERRRIADASHWSLEDGVTDAVCLSQRRVGSEGLVEMGCVEVGPHLAAERIQNASHVGVLVGQSPGEGNFLPHADVQVRTKGVGMDQLLPQPQRPLDPRCQCLVEFVDGLCS